MAKSINTRYYRGEGDFDLDAVVDWVEENYPEAMNIRAVFYFRVCERILRLMKPKNKTIKWARVLRAAEDKDLPATETIFRRLRARESVGRSSPPDPCVRQVRDSRRAPLLSRRGPSPCEHCGGVPGGPPGLAGKVKKTGRRRAKGPEVDLGF